MYKPREKFKNVDFGPKNDIYPSLGKIRTFLKKWVPSLFSNYWTLT